MPTTRRSAALGLTVVLLSPLPAFAGTTQEVRTVAGPATAQSPTPDPATLPTPTSSAQPPVPGATPVGGPGLAGDGVLTDLPPGVPEPPEIPAGAYLIADLDDGRVVLAKNAHLQSRPASTLKALTALVVAGNLAPETIVESEYEDAAIDGSKVGMVEDEEYSVRQLLQALLLTSGNDAANALARANGGMEATAQEMNELATHLGAADTHAVNTSGLDAPGQMTSVYDLALIGRAAVEDPVVAPYLVEKVAEFPGRRTAGPGSRRERFEINNHNRLLWNYEGTIGVKNGYTQAARQTYIGAARRGDASYVITYLGGQSVGWRDTAALLDWAFAHGDQAGPVGELIEPGSLAEAEAEQAQPAETPAVGAADTHVDPPEEAAAAFGTAATSTGPLVAVAAVGGLIVVGGLLLVRRRGR